MAETSENFGTPVNVLPGRVACVLGASGATGQKLLPLLLESPEYDKVIVLVRREITIWHPKLVTRIVRFDNLAREMEGLRVDDCFCTFGTTIRIAGSEEAMTRIDHGYVVDFARAAMACGATRFAYLSAANADPMSTVFYARLKGTTEAVLKQLGFNDLAIYRPSMIIAERSDRRWVESLLFPALPVIDRLLFGRLRKYRSISVDLLAKAIARFARERERGTHIYFWQQMVKADENSADRQLAD